MVFFQNDEALYIIECISTKSNEPSKTKKICQIDEILYTQWLATESNETQWKQ